LEEILISKDPILLYDSSDKENHVRVSTYEKWRDEQQKIEIADFIYERHYQRYIKPFEFDDRIYKKEYKNGFAIMASCCLLIETLESFYRGWAQSKNELNFHKFFSRDSGFKAFATDDMPTQFYKHIRCGILHQGETTGGWAISRTGTKLIDKSKREINATLLAEQLKKSLGQYRDDLKKSDWDSQIWKNAREKMKSILKNCR
jgi:hypothetical protein